MTTQWHLEPPGIWQQSPPPFRPDATLIGDIEGGQRLPPPPHPLLRGPAVYRPAREPRRWHVPMSRHWIGWASAGYVALVLTSPAAAWWLWLAAACVLLRAALT